MDFVLIVLSVLLISLLPSLFYSAVLSQLYLLSGESIDFRTCALVVFPFVFYYNFRSQCYCKHGLFDGNATNCKECRLEQEREIKIQEEKLLKEKHLQEKEAKRREGIRLYQQELERRRKTRQKDLDQLIALSPEEFEKEIAEMFKTLGFTVKLTPFTRDGGKDAIMMKDGKKYLVECKKYSHGNMVSRPEVQKFYGAIAMENANGGYFVTTSRFSDNARLFVENEYIKEKNIELINGEELMLMLEKLYPGDPTS